MRIEKIKAVSGETAQVSTSACAVHSTATPKKWQRVLTAFINGKSFNRFEAERHLSDHCLHTTVSTIQSRGVTVAREFETVPGYLGIPTRVCRYWIDRSAGNLKKAQALLAPNHLEACNE